MEEKRKKSLLRYIAIMFVVAFILVLISLIGQTRNISELSRHSASALQNAEQLQNDNRQLQEQVVTLTEQLAQAQQENRELSEDIEELEGLPRPEDVQKAYEMLLKEETEKLEQYRQYLGSEGLAAYENLTKEGNEE